MSTSYKNRPVAIGLAIASLLFIPGIHKFYLRQPAWGVLYLLIGFSPLGVIPKISSMVEALWYLAQGQHTFDQNFNSGTTLMPQPISPVSVAPAMPPVNAAQVGAVADALRQLDQLRQDGLISEYEFEQKRRQLLDRML
ncbi:MAG: SHOCT domain-containing protein [Kaiparowitsia implicata GSE-PSE-MK54-09C]|jgi:TM2 domain-containing membrane protein YozV|nr:SHOCT domain-containing protein [Kaiparowitsia implicata GSE-PSE-MK54-09C]